ncbi:MAG: TVP38/TMEM64 family protein [Methanobacteriota archaeon]
MGIYALTLLFLGILIISFIFARLDLTRPKTLVLLLLTLAVFLAVFFSIHHHFQKTCVILTDESLTDIKNLIQSWGVAAPLMSILLMTLQAVIAPIPAFLITATNGLVFGVYWGTVISWMGAMCGALVSFMLSRLFFERFAKRILGHKKGIEYLGRLSSKYGFKVILTARLLPFISFDLISYVAGVSPIKIRWFLLATGIGMLPATIVYTVFGFEIENLKKYSESLFTFSILAVLGLIFIWTIQGIVKRRKDTSVTNRDRGLGT